MPLTLGLDPITRGWAIVTSAGVIRLGLGFVASLLIARALGPTDYGTYAVLAATVGIIGGVAEGGLTEAAVLRVSALAAKGDPARVDAADRARAFFWLRLGLAAAVVATGCAVAGILGGTLLRVDDGLLRWALLGIVATAASGAVSAILQATGAFARMSSLTLINTGLTALMALALSIAQRLDLLAALIVLGIGTSLATFVAGARMLPSGLNLALPKVEQVKREARHLVRIGRWLWLASLFAMLTANLEVLLLNGWIALPLVGAYALALNLASKADLVNHSLYTVLLPGVANLGTPSGMREYVKRSSLRSGVIAGGLIALIPVARPLVTLFYGDAYQSTVPFLQWLLGIAVFDVVATPLLLLPLAYREARLLAAGDATRAVVLFLVAMTAIPLVGPFGAILARFASRIAGAAVVLGALWLSRATLQVQHEESPGVAH